MPIGVNVYVSPVLAPRLSPYDSQDRLQRRDPEKDKWKQTDGLLSILQNVKNGKNIVA